MDTNISRTARKAKRLTQNQFIRELNKNRNICNNQKYFLFYINLLSQCVLEIKTLGNVTNIKYPIAIMLYALYNIEQHIGPIYKNRKLFTDILESKGDYFIHLISVERSIALILDYANIYLFNLSDESTDDAMTKAIGNCLKAVNTLALCFELDRERLFYTANEYFKELLPDINADRCDRLLNKVVSIRDIYMARTELKRSGFLGRALSMKFEELFND